MAGPLCICRTCGNIFQNDTIMRITGNVQNIVFTGGRTNCPCGGIADIQTATYSNIDHVLRMVSGSPFTRSQFDRLNNLRHQAQQTADQGVEEIPQEFIEALETINPVWSAAAKLIKGQKLGLAFFLLFLSLLYKQCENAGGGGMTLNLGPQQTIINTYNVTAGDNTTTVTATIAPGSHTTSTTAHSNKSDTPSKRQLRRMRGRAKSCPIPPAPAPSPPTSGKRETPQTPQTSITPEAE